MCPSESAVLDFVEGSLQGAEAETFHQHLDTCQTCQRLVAEVARAENPSLPPPAIARGDTLERFLILDELGRGGMGVVYAAFDPQLDRKVALKLLRPDARGAPAADQRRRLLKEAQALARLSHPHVVRVYEAREVGDQVFVVMELVEGQTLGQYLARPRPWREVLDVFLKAGHGLHAAHRAGLVHRDFKPENVLIGKDGRVAVTDFGLARLEPLDPSLHPEPEPVPTPRPTSRDTPTGEFQRPLTRTGAVLGTPAFMAPEQWDGAPADPRSDQFSFCVALHQGLYGARPFAGQSTADLKQAVKAGQVQPPPRGARVPSRLRRALLRGLSVSPQDRFPSMEALLSELSRNPFQRWRAPLGLAAALGLFAVGAALGAFRTDAAVLCRGGERKLQGAWDAARKAKVREALLSDRSPYAGGVWIGVERELDKYATQWVEMHNEACEATRVRREQSETLLDLRVTCLERRARDLEALTNLFIHAREQATKNAVQAVYGLPPLKQCAETDALAAQVPPPQDGRVAEQVKRLHGQLSEVRALMASNRFEPALQLAQEAAAEARTVEHAPTRAEVFFLLGTLRTRRGDGQPAEEALFEAALAADAGRHDRLAALARIELIRVRGELLNRFSSVEPSIREARATLQRFGSDADMESTLETNIAGALNAQEKCEEAQQHLTSALTLADKAYSPDDPRRAQILHNMGNSLHCLGKLDDALRRHGEALRLRERTFGPHHPEVAFSLSKIGNVLFTQQKFDDAHTNHLRALEIREQSLGTDAVLVGQALVNVGVDLIELKRNQEGREYFRRGLALYEKELGADSPWLAHPLINLGHVELDLGDAEEAVRVSARAIQLLAGRDDELMAVARFNLARALRKAGKDPRRAKELAKEARAYYARRPGARPVDMKTIDDWLADEHAL
jgi:tetratricopeptide (TPR) repeat protein